MAERRALRRELPFLLGQGTAAAIAGRVQSAIQHIILRRNNVMGTQLIDAEVAEAWREDSTDYATIAMRYESIDVMLDRRSGAVIEGDPTRPTQATELWTFAREANGSWRLSAVQEA